MERYKIIQHIFGFGIITVLYVLLVQYSELESLPACNFFASIYLVLFHSSSSTEKETQLTPTESQKKKPNKVVSSMQFVLSWVLCIMILLIVHFSFGPTHRH